MIHVFESLAPTNFFSPFYKYFMYENMSDIDIEKLKSHILNIEKDIIKLAAFSCNSNKDRGDRKAYINNINQIEFTKPERTEPQKKDKKISDFGAVELLF